MSKGSRRRLQQVADKQMQSNWDTIFNKKKNESLQDVTELNDDSKKDCKEQGKDNDKSNPSM